MHFACEGQFAGFDIIDIGVTPDIVLTGLVKRILKSGFFIFDNKSMLLKFLFNLYFFDKTDFNFSNSFFVFILGSSCCISWIKAKFMTKTFLLVFLMFSFTMGC